MSSFEEGFQMRRQTDALESIARSLEILAGATEKTAETFEGVWVTWFWDNGPVLENIHSSKDEAFDEIQGESWKSVVFLRPRQSLAAAIKEQAK